MVFIQFGSICGKLSCFEYLFFFLFACCCNKTSRFHNWHVFFAGPAFWGLINPQWNMCNKGRRQSPINIEPDKLLFDPHLRALHVDKTKVSSQVEIYIVYSIFNVNHSISDDLIKFTHFKLFIVFAHNYIINLNYYYFDTLRYSIIIIFSIFTQGTRTH